MQATSPTYRAVGDIGWLTTSSLVLIVVFAAVVVFAIIHGMRLSARRNAARRIEEERVEAEVAAAPEAETPPTAPAVERAVQPKAFQRDRREQAVEPAPPAPEPTPIPTAPTPPPLDAGPVAGTPAADPLPDRPGVADEPIAAAAPLEASPAIEAEPAPAMTTRAGGSDRPVTILKGLGPKVATRLGELGITSVGDLAALDAAQAEAIDARLGPFTGRMARDRWLEQAQLLVAGNDKGFEAEFGKL